MKTRNPLPAQLSLLTLLLIFLLTGCEKILYYSGEEQFLRLNSDYLFDQSKLHTFELNLPKQSLAKLDANPAAEGYVKGALTFEGETLNGVGIRYKGSVGAFYGCVSGEDWSNPSGRKTCTKLSMKIKINPIEISGEGAAQTFYGLKKLQFHSQNLDPSQMHERLGYWLFRQMGVAAPRSVHARLIVNGQYYGLFALTEQIDEQFTGYHFPEGNGNLYKEVWPLDNAGQALGEEKYRCYLETNEYTSPSAELMRNFALELEAAPDSTALQTVISDWMNLDEIISYCVVDRTIRVDDGAFHWYCNGNECTNHNYFWYESPAAQKLHLIPWDMDNTFENIYTDLNPVTSVADDWGKISANCEPFAYGELGILQRSAACDKLTAGWASFTGAYSTKKSDFIAGPLAEANTQIDLWAEQIRAATLEASVLHEDALTLEKWEDSIADLKAKIEYAQTH